MKKMLFLGLALLLAALPGLADNTITHGSDFFQTAGDGTTYAQVSLPAGYFCTGSAAYSGTIVLAGVPVATSPANVLGNTDTIIERLSDTTFNSSNVATVNAVVRVANFKSTSPITVTGCSGSSLWDVTSSAAPTQSAFAMTIYRSSSTATGGTFDSTVTINPRLTFTQQGSSVTRTLDQSTITFSTSGASWTHQPGSGGLTYTAGSVQVDTDGNGVPDTNVPASSNFAAGWTNVPQSGCASTPCPVPVPHSTITARHQTQPPLPPCTTTTTTQATTQSAAKRHGKFAAVQRCYAVSNTFNTLQ
jgi:hypothetical protein